MSHSSKAKLKGAQKHKTRRPENVKTAGRNDTSKASTQFVDREKSKNPNLQNKIHQETEELYRKKQVRRKIREQLDDLLKRDEEFETSQILGFINDFKDEVDLIREVLNHFIYQESFPIAMVRKYTSNGSEEEIIQLIAEHKLLARLTKHRDWIKASLPDPIVMRVETTEDGPQFDSITSESIYQHIRQELEAVGDFKVEGVLPFTRVGNYPLQLDLSKGIKLPITIRLEPQPDELPADCLNDLKNISPISLPDTVDVLTSLQDHLRKVSSSNVIAYYSQLSTILVTTYRCGYGKSSWAQGLLHEWRDKHREYSLALGMREIKAAIEQINDKKAWSIAKDYDTEQLNEEKILEITKEFLFKDSVLSQYDVELGFDGNVKQAVLPIEIFWRGLQVGEIDLYRSTFIPRQNKEPLASRDDKQLSRKLDLAINKVLLRERFGGEVSLLSNATQEFQAFVKLMKRDLIECEVNEIISSNLPTNPAILQAQTKRYPGERSSDRAERFLHFARAYAEKGDENLLEFCLMEYCYSRGCQLFYEPTRDARPYFQLFLFFYSQMPNEGQVVALYNTLSFYFRIYNIFVDVKSSTSLDIADKFYFSFLSAVRRQRLYEPLGRCIVEIAVMNSQFIFELIKRMKSNKDTLYLQIIVTSLQEANVFHLAPFCCLDILAQIDPTTIAEALSRQSLSTADQRRRIGNALLKFASTATLPISNIILNGFAARATTETKIRLAFSLLVEPFILNAPEVESNLKAHLTAEALGLPTGNTASHFLEKAVEELSSFFNGFSETQDLEVKRRYAVTIRQTIQSTKKKLDGSLRENLGDLLPRDKLEVILKFFAVAERYLTDEEAKLIHDTSLEIILLSNRTLHSAQNTHITIEIRNVGEGVADQLKLEVLPVEGKYTVEGPHRTQEIESLVGKTSVQKEILIQPLVGVNESLELSVNLRYDTFKKKGKLAELTRTNRAVWLYPESQFVRVEQHYNISKPATTWFCGRKDLLESMADNLRAGTEHDTSMIIYGLKRAGKTSVVKRFIEQTLENRGLSETHMPIYADLAADPTANEIRSDGDFLYFLVEIIVKELSSQEQHIPIPFNLFVMRGDFQRKPFEAFSVCLGQIFKAIEGRRLMLVLDEFSTLHEKIVQPKGERVLTPQMFGFLSNTIQSTHQLTFIFTGTYMLLEMMRTHVYDLAKICDPRMIGFLDDKSARQLVKEPVKRDDEKPGKGWLEYDPPVVDLIVTETHCHPFLIQYLCMQVVNKMNELRYPRVHLREINLIVNEFITQSAHEMPMLSLWNDLTTPQHKVLAVIADQANEKQSWVEVSAVANTFKKLGELIAVENIESICSSLADAELLEKAAPEQGDFYKISIPLYQRWLKQKKPVRVVFDKRPSDA